MVRSNDNCCVLGLTSTRQAVGFGLAYAAIGALAASLTWGTLDRDVSVSPRLASEARPISMHRAFGPGINSNAGLVGEVVSAESCCAKPSGCPECSSDKTCTHAHRCEDCAFCKARARRAQHAAVRFVPLHKRPDYHVESSDILAVNITPTESDKQLIDGKLLVHSDGKIDLGTWGKLHVAGLTTNEIRDAVAEFIDADANRMSVDVSVHTQNSHVYYVVTEGALDGDTAARYPVQGNETVLDAIASAGTINEMGKKRIWIARPTIGGVGTDTIIPISWRWTSPTTMVCENPLLLPGDRVFLSTPPSWIAFIERAAELTRNRQANRALPETWTEPAVR